MLKRPFRLKRSPLFHKTMSGGRKLFDCPCFLVLGLTRQYESDTPSRFGFIVSKKVHNKAHERNFIKRRLRELVRLSLQTQAALGQSRQISFVIIAKAGALGVSYQTLQQHWQKALQKF